MTGRRRLTVPAGGRIVPAAFFCLALLAAAAAGEVQDTSSPTGRLSAPVRTQSPGNPDEDKDILMREGTRLVEKTGYFDLEGDGVVFHFDGGKKRLVGLPNLTLERIATAIIQDQRKNEWSISGFVTEYRGSNYLFVQRAILKAKPAAPKKPG